MDRKRLCALVLALFLLVALLPLPAYAGEAVFSANNGLVSLRFTAGRDMDLARLTLLDGAGNTVYPITGTPGEYLLTPGTYSYYYQDASGGLSIPVTTINLSAQDRVDISLTPGGAAEVTTADTPEQSPMEVPLWSTGDAPAPDAAAPAASVPAPGEEPEQDGPAMPVVFTCEAALDYSCLRVYDADGALMPPYTSTATGATQYENYLLAPGTYRYSYRDPNRRLSDAEGSFTVRPTGMQFVELDVSDADGGMCFSATAVNPAYADVISPDYIPAPSTSPEESLEQLRRDVEILSVGDKATYNAGSNVVLGKESEGPWPTPVVYDNPASSGAGLRRNLILRQKEIAICVRCRIKPTSDVWRAMCWMIYDEAIRHSGAPTEGDYLRYEYGGVSCNGCALTSDTPGEYYYKFIYSPMYFTTLAQETELNGQVAAILEGLNLSSKSVPQKISAVYQYLCQHVQYTESEDTMIFTAYSALVKGRAACQGISVAFYRLCLELGIDTRIVTSLEMGHAWNIVKADGRHYYAVDATWDSGKSQSQWKYFLKGRANWLTEHKLGDEFIDGKFDAYDFPTEDYGQSTTDVSIYSVSMFFEGMLRIRYYFEIPTALLNTPGACIQFTQNGEVIKTTALRDAIPVKEYVCFDCGIRSDSLADPIQAKILDGSGRSLPIASQSGQSYLNGLFFSALEYAKEMKSKATGANMRALAQALEDYSYASQNFFTNSSNAIRREVSSVTASSLSAWAPTLRGQAPEGLHFATISAAVESDNSLRLILHFRSSANPNSYRYEIDGKSATLRRGTDESWYLSVDNIAANELDTAHRFTISDGTRSCTVTASVLSYARDMIEQGDADRANLGRALYLYNRAADTYFGT